MDQVKKFLAVLGKHHFWLLAVLAILVVVAGRFLAVGTLTEQTEKNHKVVKTTFETLGKVQRTEAHPNDKINEGIAKQTDEQRRRVEALWGQLYGKQKEDVLHWPKELGENFITRINRLKFGDPLPVDMLADYRDYVRERFGQLPGIVKASARSVAKVSAGGSDRSEVGPPGQRAEGADVAADEDYLVEWEDYGTIAGKLVWNETPTSLKVWITQEDLWVYETLLTIVARTNSGATGPHDAPVKTIRRLEVGQEAAAGTMTRGRISSGSASGEESVGGSGGRALPERGHEPRGRGAGGDPDADPEAAAAVLKDYRYLDGEGKPLAGDAAADLAEFKRLPVRMELVMDSREIPRLLVECANAVLPVEVKQLRVNVGTGRRSGGLRGPSQPSPSAGPGGRREGGTFTLEDPAIVPVTIQGIIYVFTPPDRKALGLPEAEQPVADTGGADPPS